MKRTTFLTSLMCGALVFGCGDDKTPGQTTNPSTNPSSAEEGDSSESGGNEETGGNETTNPTTDGPGSTTNDGTDPTNVTGMTTNVTTATEVDPSAGTTTCGFICPDDMPTGECDVFAQDCPEGEKCAAYADDGGSSWNNTKCVAVTGTDVPGDDCTVEGNGVSGIDSCVAGAMCWDTDAENNGYCVGLCTGTIDAPVCEGEFACVVVNEGVLNLCLDQCDPLVQNCPMDDDLCIPSDQAFVCVLDASGDEGQVNDPCMFANACDKGLYCIASANGMECDQASMGCCQPFCDLEVMDPDAACMGQGQTCVPWFEMGTAPPGYEFVGICAIAA